MQTRGNQPSPCVRQCCLDGDQCLGCGRLMPEILEWAAASNTRQLEIILAAAERRAQRDAGNLA
ncbi:MAG TPA: DUF1289 domain-containing protein [Pseudomonas xinjiangensis]|uniref:DUF1289 domain-containing protein n=2 Tax=root TaxID=1 RepID=A0A7V1BPA5_9GAMM|nr:DUF1289 domain-containing protein [Halopseudomonas xinjiangensis]HEC49272.1 DUF1289 domain-containing protein [Halopseudomonas xinjiangensis]